MRVLLPMAGARVAPASEPATGNPIEITPGIKPGAACYHAYLVLLSGKRRLTSPPNRSKNKKKYRRWDPKIRGGYPQREGKKVRPSTAKRSVLGSGRATLATLVDRATNGFLDEDSHHKMRVLTRGHGIGGL